MMLPATIARRSPKDLLLALEAVILLAVFRLCLALIPVRTIIRTITHGKAREQPGSDSDAVQSEPTDRAMQVARRVRWAVCAAARHSVVEFVCFPQTLAGYTMLRCRGVPSTMVYGVARSPEGELIAHTWLMVGDRLVTGGAESSRFTAVERWT
jgi:hypothetical protein